MVYLYADGGDNIADGVDDVWIATTTTDGSGVYEFSASDGAYFVVVDSKTIVASAGLVAPLTQADTWAEQTYGSTGAYQANGSGGTQIRGSAGAVFGGRLADQSDDASSLATAEHVNQVFVSNASISNRDFGFSFNVVTNTLGGDAADHDLTHARSVQGSLRQFIQNANALSGANAMRFVPADPITSGGGGGTWGSIAVTNALPTITDADTTIDGTAYNYADGTTIRDTNSGVLGTGGTVGVDALLLAQVDRPELEIYNDRSVNVVGHGLRTTANGLVIDSIGIYGFGTGVSNGNITFTESVNGGLVTGSVIGSTASEFSDPGSAARTGGRNIGALGHNITIDGNLIGYSHTIGIYYYRFGFSRTSPTTGLTIIGNEIRSSGVGDLNGDGMQGAATGMFVSGNLIVGNAAYGIESTTAKAAGATGNQYTNNTISGNGLGGNETDGIKLTETGSTVFRNRITNNTGSGVSVAGHFGFFSESRGRPALSRLAPIPSPP